MAELPRQNSKKRLLVSSSSSGSLPRGGGGSTTTTTCNSHRPRLERQGSRRSTSQQYERRSPASSSPRGGAGGRPVLERQGSYTSKYERHDINNRTIAEVVASAKNGPCKHKVAKELRQAAKEDFHAKKQESRRHLITSRSNSTRSFNVDGADCTGGSQHTNGSLRNFFARETSTRSVKSIQSAKDSIRNLSIHNNGSSIRHLNVRHHRPTNSSNNSNHTMRDAENGYTTNEDNDGSSFGDDDDDNNDTTYWNDNNHEYDDDDDDNNGYQKHPEEHPRMGRPRLERQERERSITRTSLIAPRDEYRDRFLDVCRLDEARSKLIGKVEEPNMFILLRHWTGTILNEVIYDAVFWLTILLYLGLRIWIRNVGSRTSSSSNSSSSNGVGGDGTIEAIATESTVLDSLPIVGGFLTFFLVFFVNQNHGRYYSLHDSTMLIMGRICDLASLMASSPSLPIERSRRINRFCNAAHVVMYAGLTEYLQEGQLVHNLCRDYALLTEKETERMEQCGLYKGKASACFELLTWALMDINRALDADLIDPHQASEMREHIVTFRSTIAKIVVTCLCPIPFFYVHFLSLLTAIYLPLFALMVAFKTGFIDDYNENSIPWYAEIVGFFLVLMQCIFVVGLRILGQELGNPYGEDFVDIQITTYIIMVLSTSNRILESMDVNDIDGEVNPETELSLKLGMVNLGDAWGIKQSQKPPPTIKATTTTSITATSPSSSRRSSYSSVSSSSSSSTAAATMTKSPSPSSHEEYDNSSSSGSSSEEEEVDDAAIDFVTTSLAQQLGEISDTHQQIEALERELFGDNTITTTTTTTNNTHPSKTIQSGNSNGNDEDEDAEEAQQHPLQYDQDTNHDIDSNRNYSLLPKELSKKYTSLWKSSS